MAKQSKTKNYAKKTQNRTVSPCRHKTDVLLINLARMTQRKGLAFFDIGPPYGLAMIAAVLQAAGFSVKGIDFSETPLKESLFVLENSLKKYRPAIVGISCESWSRGSFFSTIALIKKFLPGVKIVAGGSYASEYYRFLLSRGGVDCIVLGEGEIAMRDVVEAFLGRGGLLKIPGLVLPGGKSSVITDPPVPLLDLDALPYPAYDVFDIKERISTALQGSRDDLGFDPFNNINEGLPCSVIRRGLVLLSARGCVGQCIFCPNSKIEKHKVRLHSVSYFLDMVGFFSKTYHLRDYIFGDNFFTFNRDRTMAVCRGIVERKMKIRWAVATRFDSVDEELLRAMSEAGCVNVGYGLESYSPIVQKGMRKNLDLSRMDEAYRLTHALGMNTELMLMVGNPGDGEKAVRQTLNKVRSLDPGLVYTQIVQIYPNTRIFDIACREGLVSSDYFESASYEVPYYTRDHSESDLKILKRMLQDRIVYLNFSDTCFNKCAGCGHAQESEKMPLKRLISIASSRSRFLAFDGADPLAHPQLLNVLKMVCAAGTNTLQLYTSARLLTLPGVVTRLCSTNMKMRMMVPFFGTNAEGHDRVSGIKGSFYQSLRGMRLWKDAIAGIYITEKNAPFLEEFVKNCLHKYFMGVEFIFYSGSGWCMKPGHQEIPCWGQIKDHVCGAINFVLKQDGRCSFTGLPECMLLGFKGLIVDAWRPFDERVSNKGKVFNISRDRASEKIKTDVCKKCFWNGACEGLWKFYIDKYGSNEMIAQMDESEEMLKSIALT